MCSPVLRCAAETHLPRTPSASSLAASQADTPPRPSPEFADEVRARLRRHEGDGGCSAVSDVMASGAGRAFGAATGAFVCAVLLAAWCISAAFTALAELWWLLCPRAGGAWAARDGCEIIFVSVECELRYGRQDRARTTERLSAGYIGVAIVGSATAFYCSYSFRNPQVGIGERGVAGVHIKQISRDPESRGLSHA